MLSGDALVMTLRGQCLLKDLLEAGPSLVLCWDGERVTVGTIIVHDEFREVIPHRLDLDDANTFACCSETMVLLRDGAPRYVADLKDGQSLLPLYMKIDSAKYPCYQEPGEWHKKALTASDRNRWRRLSRLVAEWKLGRRCEPGDIVSYVSSNRMDCHPDNLKISRKKRKPTQKKADFAEHLFEAQRFIDQHNHKVNRVHLDTSRNLLSIRGLGTTNLAVGGIFVSVDSE